MCNCLKEIETQLRGNTEDESAYIYSVFNMKGAMKPKITYYYRKKKKDGNFRVKGTEGSIIPTFCPFCGKRYEDE